MSFGNNARVFVATVFLSAAILSVVAAVAARENEPKYAAERIWAGNKVSVSTTFTDPDTNVHYIIACGQDGSTAITPRLNPDGTPYTGSRKAG